VERYSLTPCLETFASLDTHGYGQVSVRGKLWLHHRLEWTRQKGPIPDGLCVLHKCDNRKCVRVSHLFLGTKRDNTLDMYRKGRGPNNKGANNGRAKISASEAKAISRSNESTKDLAARYGVAPVTIWRIKTGRSH
jgi:hypothetical protein